MLTFSLFQFFREHGSDHRPQLYAYRNWRLEGPTEDHWCYRNSVQSQALDLQVNTSSFLEATEQNTIVCYQFSPITSHHTLLSFLDVTSQCSWKTASTQTCRRHLLITDGQMSSVRHRFCMKFSIGSYWHCHSLSRHLTKRHLALCLQHVSIRQYLNWCYQQRARVQLWHECRFELNLVFEEVWNFVLFSHYGH